MKMIGLLFLCLAPKIYAAECEDKGKGKAFMYSCSGKGMAAQLSFDKLMQEARLLGTLNWMRFRYEYQTKYGKDAVAKDLLSEFDIPIVLRLLGMNKVRVYQERPHCLYVIKWFDMALSDNAETQKEFRNFLAEIDPSLEELVRTTERLDDFYSKFQSRMKIDL